MNLLTGMTNIKITHQPLPPSVGSRWNKLHSPEAWLVTSNVQKLQILCKGRESVYVCVCARMYTHMPCAHACTCTLEESIKILNNPFHICVQDNR